MSKPITCEGCYEAPAVITALLPLGTPIPMCKQCTIDSINVGGGLYVEQVDDEEE
jgi:hypothetical protein